MVDKMLAMMGNEVWGGLKPTIFSDKWKPHSSRWNDMHLKVNQVKLNVFDPLFIELQLSESALNRTYKKGIS